MPPPTKPNVIWIFGDQHRAQALGCHGDPNLHTPELDTLAAQGVDCTHAVSGFPLCCPFRGSLLTGRYPHHAVPGHEYPLDPQLPTIATALGAAGYETVYLGKWHVDGYHETKGRAAFHRVPPERRGGFDHWLGYDNNNAPWDSWVHGTVPAWTNRLTAPTGEACHERLPGYETDALTDLLLDYIAHAGTRAAAGNPKPFFAALSVQPPHDPNIAPTIEQSRHTMGAIRLRPNVPPIPAVQDRARRTLAGYYAQIENLDRNVGRVRDALEAAGLGADTHILFFSDHGDMMGSHGLYAKMNPHEESIRVPMIFGGGRCADPYALSSGRASDLPLNHVDIAPTTLGLCGVAVPDWMEGTDCSGLRDPNRPMPEMDSAYLQVVVPTGHGNSVDRPWRGVVTREGWKYVCLERQPWLLFNLKEDPYEFVNHAHNPRYHTERKRLQDRLAQWVHDTGDAFALPTV